MKQMTYVVDASARSLSSVSTLSRGKKKGKRPSRPTLATVCRSVRLPAHLCVGLCPARLSAVCAIRKRRTEWCMRGCDRSIQQSLGIFMRTHKDAPAVWQVPSVINSESHDSAVAHSHRALTTIIPTLRCGFSAGAHLSLRLHHRLNNICVAAHDGVVQRASVGQRYW